MGHVDHGKTSLLDYIRGSIVAKGEAGLITQHIGASEIPLDSIRNLCGSLLGKMKIDIMIPGLLFIDTPGHEAFTTLRKRGGAIADMAVLVVDINEGLQPQTIESMMFLKEFRTPFIIALTKIDKVPGWIQHKTCCFGNTWEMQPKAAQAEFERRMYRVVGQISQQGLECDRYDRVEDFAKKISIVPVSAVTGEGVADLLIMLAGLAQRYLKERLYVRSGEGKGTVLEVKEFRGLGTTIDVILYDGEMETGDWLVIGIKEMVVTRIKALLKPNPLKEMRVEKVFLPVKSVSAAAGVKIAAPNIEKVIPGSPFRAVKSERRIEEIKREIMEEVSEVEIQTDNTGVILKADTLGSLEALVKMLREINIPIRKADIGEVGRQDVIEVRSHPKPMIFAFNVKAADEIIKMAADNGVKVFRSDVIYRLLEEYGQWEKDSKKREEDRLLSSVARPGRFRILPGYVFRQSRPAIVGVEVTKGIVKAGWRVKKDGKIIGEIKEIQSQGENVGEAKAGEKVAISIDGAVVGKGMDEGDEIDVFLADNDLSVLRKLRHRLWGDEIELLDESER
jgi:translation initiation factor 5B